MGGRRICIVIPYFGVWPCWFGFFLKSCSHNPAIDWLFYTDCGEPPMTADNLRFVHCSFAEYKQKVSDTLGIHFDPHSAYKLCDIKPAYGLIHQQELAGYDFWGFGDVDVIYGDLQGYISDDMLRHNLVSFHGHRVGGHLCLLRNNALMRHAFQRCREWRAVFSDKNNHAFDERQFNALFMRHKNWPQWLRRLLYFPRRLMRTAYFRESYSTSFGSVPWLDGSFDFPAEWRWQAGRLTACNSDELTFPYLHFLHWKKHWPADMVMQAKPQDPVWYIRKDGIFTDSTAGQP